VKVILSICSISPPILMNCGIDVVRDEHRVLFVLKIKPNECDSVKAGPLKIKNKDTFVFNR
jgi:hypothetical protein